MRGLDRFDEERRKELKTVKRMQQALKALNGQPMTPESRSAVAECQAYLDECVLNTAVFAAMCRCALLGS